MPEKYTVFVHSDLSGIKLGRYKQPVQHFIFSLGESPFDRSDYPDLYREKEGEVKIIGSYAIVFEVDHAMKRVYILYITHADA
jgi:mRNA-degrading endonuclease RelE of RelBE toxin-antitoxin system